MFGVFGVLCRKIELLFIGGNLILNLESDLKEVFFLFRFSFFGVIVVTYDIFLFILFLVWGLNSVFCFFVLLVYCIGIEYCVFVGK